MKEVEVLQTRGRKRQRFDCLVAAVIDDPAILGVIAREGGNEVPVLCAILEKMNQIDYVRYVEACLDAANPTCFTLLILHAIACGESDDIALAIMNASVPDDSLRADLVDIGLVCDEVADALNDLLETAQEAVQRDWILRVCDPARGHWLREVEIICLTVVN